VADRPFAAEAVELGLAVKALPLGRRCRRRRDGPRHRDERCAGAGGDHEARRAPGGRRRGPDKLLWQRELSRGFAVGDREGRRGVLERRDRRQLSKNDDPPRDLLAPILERSGLMTEVVLYEVSDAIATITLNRPDHEHDG
jgi:hypothetical protein